MPSAVLFEGELIETLMQNDDIKRLVKDKVFPVRIPQGTKLPCITVQRLAGNPANTLSGASGLERIEVQIDCWSTNFLTAKILSVAVRNCMPAQGVRWGAHLYEDLDSFDEKAAYYRTIMRYYVWYLENAED